VSGANDSLTEQVDPALIRAHNRVGTVLRGKWRLDRLLGVGGMAAVYSATHRNGARAAIKVLHSELSVRKDVRARFLREGYAANSVDHPGVVRVLDDDTSEDGAVFLVMDLLEGETLEARSIRKGGRLPVPEVLSLGDQVLDVLIAAHARGVIHRDLKPENLFLTNEGRIKVLDFGIARVRELSSQSNATKSGAIMGTPAFMAPEQARGLWDEVDERTDLWAVGATLYALASGQLVHTGRTGNEQLLSAMTNAAPSLAEVLPFAPKPFVDLVDRAVAFKREDRWPDAASMQTALRAAYHVIEGGVPSDPAPAVDSTGPVAPVTPSQVDRVGRGRGVTAAPTLPSDMGGGTTHTVQGWRASLEGFGASFLGNRRRAAIALAGGAIVILVIVFLAVALHHSPPRPAVIANSATLAAAPPASAALTGSAAAPIVAPAPAPSSEDSAVSVDSLPTEAPTPKAPKRQSPKAEAPKREAPKTAPNTEQKPARKRKRPAIIHSMNW
jgi:eukaryotic-like serine/threonine-protein kinase